jgi:GDP/UDP-N,N'-diacetylbacillosamine 2-epimerase (hydrolysing)
MKKICVVTGTRAEYGLLRWVMEGIQNSSKFQLQIIATGAHLSPEFGLTYREIEQDGLTIDKKVEMLLSSDTPVGVAKAMGVGLIGFADALEQLKPDMLLVLGDRYEILSAAAAAMVARIPIAHLHGGETTEGAFDESIRHALTKMSHLHFVAAPPYRQRVIQLGENPDRVFCVGGLGVDNILRMQLLGREELEHALGFRLGKRNLLVTYHPVTLEDQTSQKQMENLLAALEKQKDTHLIFTLPNADTNGRVIIQMIEDFVAKRDNAKAFTSLGQHRYFSCLAQVDAVVGNSSSGLAEAPSFKIPTVNIGERQKGRLKAQSVIDCAPEQKAISHAIDKALSSEFQNNLVAVKNPYGNGGASDMIIETLEQISFDNLLKKKFHDFPGNEICK